MPTRDPFGWVGQTIANKLRVDAVVAEGGFAVVYRARHLGFDEPVALKCLKLPAQLEGEERDRFLRAFLDEGRLLHRLSRSNVGIVQALDVGAAVAPSGAWTPYLALEWLEGITLDDEMTDRERRGMAPRSVAEVVALLETAADALAFAHHQGVAHRDIKPSNLFLAELGGHRILKIVDFGIAKVMSDVATTSGLHAQTGAALPAFSPRYGAPEQFDRTFGATGPWTDVFAFGLVIVELITGRPALDGDETLQLFVSSSNPARRPTPRTLGARIGDELERTLRRALAVDPAERFPTLGALWSAMKTAVADDARAETSADDGQFAEAAASTSPPARVIIVAPPVVAPPVVAPPIVAPPVVARRAGTHRVGRALAIAAVCVPLGAIGLIAREVGGRHGREVAGTTTLTSSEPPRIAVARPSPSPLAPSTSMTMPASAPSTAFIPARAPAPASAVAPAGMIRASHILISYAGASSSASARTRDEARSRAEEVVARLAQGDDFAQLAAEYGDDATHTRAGDLGNFARHKFPAPFTSAAFALAVGETSGIVETRYGFHVIRRTE